MDASGTHGASHCWHDARVVGSAAAVARRTRLRAHDPPDGVRRWARTSDAGRRNGVRVPRALEPLANVALPFFSAGAVAYPFLGPETERLARVLGLTDVSWYTVFEGDHMRSALGRLQGAMAGQGDVDASAAELS